MKKWLLAALVLAMVAAAVTAEGNFNRRMLDSQPAAADPAVVDPAAAADAKSVEYGPDHWQSRGWHAGGWSGGSWGGGWRDRDWDRWGGWNQLQGTTEGTGADVAAAAVPEQPAAAAEPAQMMAVGPAATATPAAGP